jgi:hypothetical protein
MSMRRIGFLEAWRRGFCMLMLAGVASCMQPPPAPPQPRPTPEEVAARQAAEAAAIEQAAQEARLAEASRIADEAYIYGYPLVLGEVQRQLMSAVVKPAGIRAPANSLWHARRLTPAGERHPWVDDNDALASVAWLDLGREAMLFAYPEMGRRWFSFTLYSLWMPALATFADPQGGRVLVTGPQWQGTVPKGVRLVRSPTRYVALLGRIQTSGSEADLRAVHSLQSRLRLVPQTQPARSGAPSLPATDPLPPGDVPRQVVQAMDAADYFRLLLRLLGAAAPPATEDAPLLDRMARIGLEPGKPPGLDALEPAVRAALLRTPQRAMAQIAAYQPRLFAKAGNWQVAPTQGDFGTDYLRRAAVADLGWPGPQTPQILVLTTHADGEGRPLSGAHDYLLRFAKGQQPPVDGFWSLTLQTDDPGRRGFVPNSAERFSLGTRDKLPLDGDGSLNLQLQYLSPGLDNAARWLPAPKGDFMLTLRLYAPRAAPPSLWPLGRGSWTPPPVQRLP